MPYQVSEKVTRVLKEERITEEELKHMVDAAAPHTGDGFNRRYHQWVFKVNGSVVEEMRHVELRTIGRKKEGGWIEEECEECEGEGCKDCGWVGSVKRRL